MGEVSEISYVRMLVTVKNINQLKEAFKESKYYALDPVTEEKVFLLQALCLDEKGVNTWNNQQWPYEGYREVVAEDGTVNGVYEFRYYKAVDDKTAPIKDGKLEPLFEKITVPGEDVNNTDIAYLENVEIHVVAHAIQAAGFVDEDGNPDVDAAWDAFNKQNA